MAFTVKASIKKFFFDRRLVTSALDKATRKSLSKMGSFVRRRARTSLRRRKASSPPGSPPSVHSTHAHRSLKNILFAFSFGNKSVIVGPVGFPTTSKRNGAMLRNKTVPEIHEFGGQMVRRVRVRKPKSGRKATAAQRESFLRLLKEGRIRRQPAEYEYVTRNYPERPFMLPALKAEAPKFPELWARSVSEVA